MAVDTLVEDDDNYYYVNENGAMVSNQWVAIENEDAGEDDEPDHYWYYFQANGKAYKRSDSASDTSISAKTINGKKYAFDTDGRMLYGWVDAGERQTDDDAWKTCQYYFGDEDDGAMSEGWRLISITDDEAEDAQPGDEFWDEDQDRWFFFQASGKKKAAKDGESYTDKTINGKKYGFDEFGRMVASWYTEATAAVASQGTATYSNTFMYFNNPEDGARYTKGWFKVVPGYYLQKSKYEDGSEYWYYADGDGQIYSNEIKTIKGQKYGFDPVGKMLHGLYKITFDEDGRTILEAEEIESESDLPDEDEDVSVYYFGDSPKEGAMKTGTATLDIDGEKHYYKFKSSGSDKGAGVDKIDDGSIYIKGKRVEAEEGSKYEDIEYKGEHYLISTSGKIMKSKKNIKDSDDTYYCTDSKGIITYKGSEKKD